jgi:hypothetical protein
MEPGSGVCRPPIYEIKVRGRLDEGWSEWFDGMAITLGREPGGAPTTTLTGAVADQAALRSLLARIWDLNLALISVVCLQDDAR